MATTRNDLPGFPIDPDQRKAAESDAAVTVITGGPTTGKSHALVARMAFLLDLGVGPEHIACITATGTAASSLRRLMIEHPRVATVGSRLFVGTPLKLAIALARMCQGDEALNVPSDFSVWADIEAVDVMTRLRDKGKKSNVASKEIREAIAWVRRNRWPGALGEEHRASDVQHSKIAVEYRERKRWQRVMDADDVLKEAARIVRRSDQLLPDGAEAFRGHLLIDGVEDFNRSEIELLKNLAARSISLTLADDENQRVRGRYPGSKVDAIRPDGRPTVHRHLSLAQVGTAPLSQGAALLLRSPEMEGLTEHETTWDLVRGPNPRLVEVPGTKRDMALRLLGDVVANHEQGVRWEDMAILCRNTRAMAHLWTLLAHAEIPYRAMGRQPGTRISDADCIRALLTCLVNPRDLSAFSVAIGARHPNKMRLLSRECATKLWQLARASDSDLVATADAYLDQFEAPEMADLAWLVESVRCLRSMLNRPGCDLTMLLEQAQTQVRGFTGTCNISGGENCVDYGIVRLWRSASQIAEIAGESPIKQLTGFLDHTSPALGLIPESPETEGLTVCTWDGCKNQNWRAVFVFDVTDHTIPGRANGGRLRHEQRLWYTITTRATRSLVLYCLKDIGLGSKLKPTRFIEPLRPVLEMA